ncbi:signal recognition particle subunit SRP68, putative [Plasmodium gaboni]|uniref:Signal recognition particle subunit SRP68 n=1 Tax=Plasmodium gaboni TaxID=647221 RepID=A0ABY1UJQ9_9APIC|nr:signal recognition particle subunit SRP68, putative [Plasmodium gaboni]
MNESSSVENVSSDENIRSEQNEVMNDTNKLSDTDKLNENQLVNIVKIKKESDGYIKKKRNEKISFDIFFYLHQVYQKHGLYNEDISRFLLYINRRRRKIRSKILFNVKKVGKYISKIYECDDMDELFLELLLLDVEACRCRYLEIKTDVNNLKKPYRAKFSYMRRLKKSVHKMNFLIQTINNFVDKNTELQIKCYNSFIQASYLVEKKKYDECLSKTDEFLKFIKLIKRISLNAHAQTNQKEHHQNENDNKCDKQDMNNKRSSLVYEHDSINLQNESYFSNLNNNLMNSEKAIDITFDYFLSVINSCERTCSYNMKKHRLSYINEKLHEDDFKYTHNNDNIIPSIINNNNNNNNNNINESYCNNISTSDKNYYNLNIQHVNNDIIINLYNVEYKWVQHNNNNNILKIQNIIKNVKKYIEDDYIYKMNIEYNENNIKDLSNNIQIVLDLFKKYDKENIIKFYGDIYSNYYECLRIIHEELITCANNRNNNNNNNNNNNKNSDNSDNSNNNIDNNNSSGDYNKLKEKIWTLLENYFLAQKLYVDIERTILILMKSLLDLYYTNKESKNFHFNKKKKNFGDLIDDMPILHTGIRYADILKQNIEELRNIENKDIFINILQIIKNLKSFCLAFYYALNKKNTEAHVLFDVIKTRNYIYIKKEHMNNIKSPSLLRISILFNRLQDVISLINEKYYFRHLSIYALQVKNKSCQQNQLFQLDNSLFAPKMKQISLNPLHIDMTQMYRTSYLLGHDQQRGERGSLIRGLLRSFWK